MMIGDMTRNSTITQSLLSKQGHVVMALARQLLSCEPGDTIMRVQEYAAELEASTGTIHAALSYLQDSEAVTLEGRGRLGTVVHQLDYPLLWKLAFGRSVVGALPLPYTKRFEGLATGIREQFDRCPVSLDVRFLRGSSHRLQGLASNHFDWVLISRFAAETASVHGFAIETVMLLGPGTYTVDHVLLGKPGVGGLRDGLRVGIDTRSSDHSWIVRTLCRGLKVEFVEINYSQVLKLLESGVIDVTVGPREHLPANHEHFSIIPLSSQAGMDLTPFTEAALVVDRGNRAAVHILKSVLEAEQLLHSQREIVNLARLPAY
jgi:hypothetical protein